MKLVPIAASKVLGRQLLHVQKNSPALMFGAGIAVSVLATVKACQATLKLEETLAEAEKDMALLRQHAEARPDKRTTKQLENDMKFVRIRTARNVAKLYAPAIGLGVVAVGLLTSSHVVMTRRNASLAAAYAVLDRGFREYRERVLKEYGSEKDQEFRYGTRSKEIVEEGEHGHEIKTIKRHDVTGRSIYARLFDDTNRNWERDPRKNRVFIQCQQDWANDKLRARGHVFLNEVYDMLGMERTPEGQAVGWVIGGNQKTTAGDGYVDFGLDWQSPQMRDFMNGDEASVLLDFNVDGSVWDLI